jgi:hypothetical protein
VGHISQRRERPIKHLDNGRITSAISLHGIYRLSEATAKLFDIQLAGALKLKQYQNNRGAS